MLYKEKLEALKKHGLSTPQRFPLQITGWPLELMAYAYLAVSPPSMTRQFEEMAVTASNKTTSKKGMKYPEIEEQALQFVLDSCESSITKYSKFLQASGSTDLDVTSPKQLNRKLFLKQLAVDLCTSERRILYRAQYKDYFYDLPYNTGYQIFVLRLRKIRDEIMKCTLYICRYIL